MIHSQSVGKTHPLLTVVVKYVNTQTIRHTVFVLDKPKVWNHATVLFFDSVIQIITIASLVSYMMNLRLAKSSVIVQVRIGKLKVCIPT